MQVNTDDAIVIYARACRAWYGMRATRVAKTRAQELRKRGDTSGFEAWSKVAEEVSRLQKSVGRRRNAGAKLY
jgi:hypothetical protein